MNQTRPTPRMTQSRATASALSLLLAIAVVGGGFEVASGAVLHETPRGETSRELRPVRTFVRAMRELVGELSRPQVACPRVCFAPAARIDAERSWPMHAPVPPGLVDLRPEWLDLPPPAL